MTLSPRERSLLTRIETELSREDPALAARLTTEPERRNPCVAPPTWTPILVSRILWIALLVALVVLDLGS